MSQVQSQAELKEQLMLLKGITKMTGALHEAQLTQLKLWGRLLFDEYCNGCVKFTINADMDKDNVTFLFPAMKGRKMKQAASLLAIWTQELLGYWWNVKIKSSDSLIFSKKRKNVKPKSDIPTEGTRRYPKTPRA